MCTTVDFLMFVETHFLKFPGSLQRLQYCLVVTWWLSMDLRFSVPCRKIRFIYNSVRISGKVFYKSFIIQAAILTHHSNNTHLYQFTARSQNQWRGKRGAYLSIAVPFSFQQHGSKDGMRMWSHFEHHINLSLPACLPVCLPVWLAPGRNRKSI